MYVNEYTYTLPAAKSLLCPAPAPPADGLDPSTSCR